jgi:hypothetical protein
MSPFVFAISLASVLLVPFLGFFVREEIRDRRAPSDGAQKAR